MLIETLIGLLVFFFNNVVRIDTKNIEVPEPNEIDLS